MRVFYFGYPGPMGGANTEMLHTIAVWRQAGIDVTLIPTWGADAAMEERLNALDCATLHVKPEEVANIPGLPGSICMAMCNSHFWEVFPTLKQLGCKTVWSSAMTFEYDDARNAYRHYGVPDAHHFQTVFQREQITADLAKIGIVPNGHLIRGAFDFTEYPFSPRPHAPDEDFWIGRLSRPDQDKWSSNHWHILAAVPYPQRRALAMGWTLALTRKCGEPPPWSETLLPQQIPVPKFFARCHAMIGINGGARENYPRVGLEAMAAGVPLVVQGLWGWREMVEHRKTGFLCDNDQDFAFYLALLARHEELRMEIAGNARAAVERLADPMTIGRQWRELFESLAANRVQEAAA